LLQLLRGENQFRLSRFACHASLQPETNLIDYVFMKRYIQSGRELMPAGGSLGSLFFLSNSSNRMPEGAESSAPAVRMVDPSGRAKGRSSALEEEAEGICFAR